MIHRESTRHGSYSALTLVIRLLFVLLRSMVTIINTGTSASCKTDHGADDRVYLAPDHVIVSRCHHAIVQLDEAFRRCGTLTPLRILAPTLIRRLRILVCPSPHALGSLTMHIASMRSPFGPYAFLRSKYDTGTVSGKASRRLRRVCKRIGMRMYMSAMK